MRRAVAAQVVEGVSALLGAASPQPPRERSEAPDKPRSRKLSLFLAASHSTFFRQRIAYSDFHSQIGMLSGTDSSIEVGPHADKSGEIMGEPFGLKLGLGIVEAVDDTVQQGDCVGVALEDSGGDVGPNSGETGGDASETPPLALLLRYFPLPRALPDFPPERVELGLPASASTTFAVRPFSQSASTDLYIVGKCTKQRRAQISASMTSDCLQPCAAQATRQRDDASRASATRFQSSAGSSPKPSTKCTGGGNMSSSESASHGSAAQPRQPAS
mmetsp:Transcript_119787/g.382363  ORF Transcript_119787/g.382363 Transcript_119787/m.382363 type:complete len:273 (+) Transcript_119787:643-1461(+)